MDYKMLSNKMKYTSELLDSVMLRDNAVLIGNYDKLNRNAPIHFICHCGNEAYRNFRAIHDISAKYKQCINITQQEKKQLTELQRYGVKNFAQREDIKKKMKETCMKKYGVEHPLQNKDIINKIKKTRLEHYGFENLLQVDKFKEKCKKTTIIRYNTEYASQSQRFKDKVKQTSYNKYGVNYTLQVLEFREKGKQTCLERYGVENPSQSTNVKDKIKATCLARYGVEYPQQCQEIAEKTQKNAKKYKEYIMPSGTIRKVQGYEPFALDELIKRYQEDNIITDRKEIPRITYMINDKKKYYFPDIFIKSINTIIEVKSTWTYQSKKDNVHEKESATKMAGYKYEIWVFDAKGNKI
jgi:hypothetical protein